MAISLNQVILFAENVNRLGAFYREHFGFETLEEINDEWMVLHAGQTTLALHRAGAEYRPDENHQPGAGSNVKLVFDIDGELQPFREQLLGKSVQLGTIKSFPGYDYILCDGTDIEGNVFQLRQRIVNTTQ